MRDKTEHCKQQDYLTEQHCFRRMGDLTGCGPQTCIHRHWRLAHDRTGSHVKRRKTKYYEYIIETKKAQKGVPSM